MNFSRRSIACIFSSALLMCISCGKPSEAEVSKISSFSDSAEPPSWALDAVWYQIFPERFRNGDLRNDVLSPFPVDWRLAWDELAKIQRKITPWTADWFDMVPHEKQMEEVIRKYYSSLSLSEIQSQIIRERRYGGDLAGIKQSVGYLKNLGVNAVYLNPVFESDSEHKYDTKDYRHVDSELGTLNRNGAVSKEDRLALKKEVVTDPTTWAYTTADKEFLSTVTELQNNGIRVVIDGVFNHSAANSPFMEDVARYGTSSRYFNWYDAAYLGQSKYWDKECSLSTFFPNENLYPHAKNIRFSAWFGFCYLANHRQGFPQTVFHPELTQYIFDVIDRWFAPKTVDGIAFRGVDGIRLDVYGMIPAQFWQKFRQKVKSVKPDALIVAEEWWDGFDILQGDQVDATMNYTVRTFVESWFINPFVGDKFRPSDAKKYVDYRMSNHRSQTKHVLWSMLTSHDTDRVLSKTIMQNRLLSTEPHRDLNWDREKTNKPDKGAAYNNDKPGFLEREFFKSIVALQFAYPGAPLIYYGDEVGMWGADDPTDRKPMVWGDLAGDSQRESRCTTEPGIFCRQIPSITFSVEPDLSLFNTYQRLIKMRAEHVAVRRGEIDTSLWINVSGQWIQSGTTASDPYYIWGFERHFENDRIYFVSNQNLEFERQSFSLATHFQMGTKVTDVINNESYIVERNGIVRLAIARDRAVLLVANP